MYGKAFSKAASAIDGALGEAYRKEEPPQGKDEYIAFRDALFRQDPSMLRDFVAQSLGTRNEEQIQRGIQQYHEEMRARNG